MRIAGLIFGLVTIIASAVLISCGMYERSWTEKFGGVWVPACVPRRQFMEFRRVSQVV